MAISLLLLESDESARSTYTRALRDAGCTVSTPADSAHAYTTALVEMPDVIVVGFDPSVREDRFELCKRLGAEPRTRQVPILLTSAVVNQNDLELATSTGVLALVLESRDAAKLVSAVRGVVAARLKPPPLRASLERPKTTPRTRTNAPELKLRSSGSAPPDEHLATLGNGGASFGLPQCQSRGAPGQVPRAHTPFWTSRTRPDDASRSRMRSAASIGMLSHFCSVSTVNVTLGF